MAASSQSQSPAEKAQSQAAKVQDKGQASPNKNQASKGGGRFQVLRGLHVVVNPSTGEQTFYGPDEKAGDVVDTPDDLVRKHGLIRFRRISGTPEMEPADELDDMNVEELRLFAEEKEIPLGTARLKREIVAAVRRALLG